MKKPTALTAFVLSALAASCLAEDAPNPFVKKADTTKPQPPAGASFASLLENILVPPDLLDDWLREHPMKEDASDLRAAAQGWISEGKAKLDHTSFSYGSAGRETTNSTILEKIYPTEFVPNGPGVWPLPTAFDTRNLGRDMETGVASLTEGSPLLLWLKGDNSEMISSFSWQPLVERTRQPDDVFLPLIHHKEITLNDADDSPDPFADPKQKALPKNRHVTSFKPDLIQLVSRFDPVYEGDPGDRLSRLAFYRGSIAPPHSEGPVKNLDVSRLTIRTLRVSLPAFSAWMQSRSPLAAATGAWEIADVWRKEGNAPSIGELSSRIDCGYKVTLKNNEEFIYPTEYEPMNETTVMEKWEEGKKVNGKDGVASMKREKITPISGTDAASMPTAFDTRNLGTTVEAVLTNNDQGLILHCDWQRVTHPDDSVCRRIKVGEEWIADMKMPVFSNNGITADVRVHPGKWILLGANMEFLKTEKIDHDHCLLVFVKVE